LLKVCYVPATSAASSKVFFLFFTLQPFTVQTRQTRQAVCAFKQSISLDVYGFYFLFLPWGGQGRLFVFKNQFFPLILSKDQSQKFTMKSPYLFISLSILTRTQCLAALKPLSKEKIKNNQPKQLAQIVCQPKLLSSLFCQFETLKN
jgi:hypothetical protein